MKNLDSLLKQIGTEFKAQAKANFIEYRTEQLAKHHIGDGKYIKPFPKGYADDEKVAANRINEISTYLQHTPEQIDESPVELGYKYSASTQFNKITIWTLKPNHAEMLEAAADKYAHDVVESWIFKQGEKFNAIIKAKADAGVKGKVRVAGSLGYNHLRFEFKDGSAFTVQNQIVTSYIYSTGTVFNRFPTTFHNVTLADGSKMKTPSEAKMKKSFCNVVIKAKDNSPKVHLKAARFGQKNTGICAGSAMGARKIWNTIEDKSKVTCSRCLKEIERLASK